MNSGGKKTWVRQKNQSAGNTVSRNHPLSEYTLPLEKGMGELSSSETFLLISPQPPSSSIVLGMSFTSVASQFLYPKKQCLKHPDRVPKEGSSAHLKAAAESDWGKELLLTYTYREPGTA